MKKHAEVIIIGGGINGCAAAYYLAKSGRRDVIVLESSSSIGHGGSSRNVGGVRQSGRDVRELPYCMYGVQNLWPTLSEELGIDVEYHQSGNLRLGKTPEHLQILNKLATNAQKVGLDVRMISKEEVHERNPWLADDVIGASWCPTDGHANPLKTTLAYYIRSMEMGVQYITGANVIGLKKQGGKLRRVLLADGTVFESDIVILAAGYASRDIARTVDIDLPINRQFCESLVTEAQPHMFDMMLGVATADFYGHQADHGSFVFGSSCGQERFFQKAPEDLTCNSLTMSACCRAVISWIPKLADVKIVRTWGGWLDMCYDGVPVISPVEEVPGLIIAAGFTGHGFGTAPSVGLILAQMANGEKPVVDMTELRYNRFVSKH